MKMELKEIDGIVVVAVEGRLDLGPEAAIFQDLAKQKIQEGKKRFLLNLKKITWINTSGLSSIVSFLTTIRNHGGDLVLCGVGEKVNSLLTITKLITVFEIFPSEEEAIASFKP